VPPIGRDSQGASGKSEMYMVCKIPAVGLKPTFEKVSLELRDSFTDVETQAPSQGVPASEFEPR
jgi:hypothetical protein